MEKNKEKVIVILGPTSSGKSTLAVLIAKKFDGEVVSADSRQIYNGLDIGTGKITEEEMNGIPHHLISFLDPKVQFSAGEFKKKAQEKIEEIIMRGKLPIVCGGSGFYIEALVKNTDFPSTIINKKMRAELENKDIDSLYKKLLKLDSDRAKNIDRKNKRRLIRAIEIASAQGKVPKLKTKESPFIFLQIGLDVDKEALALNINKRVRSWIKKGIIKETKKIKNSGLSWKRIKEIGMEYRVVAEYIKGNISKKELEENLNKETRRYAKRQKTWFKRDKRILWFKPNNENKILTEINRFLLK